MAACVRLVLHLNTKITVLHSEVQSVRVKPDQMKCEELREGGRKRHGKKLSSEGLICTVTWRLKLAHLNTKASEVQQLQTPSTAKRSQTQQVVNAKHD